MFTLNPTAPPFVPGCQYVSDLNSVISKVTHINLSQTVVPTTSNPNKQTDNSSLTVRANIAKSSGFVYFHKFLEIRCSFLCPNDLDNSFLSRDNSEFVIFHNNINSMCDTETDKIGKVKNIFQNCSDMPDLLAFSDTRVDDNSPIPPLSGYHDFNFTLC